MPEIFHSKKGHTSVLSNQITIRSGCSFKATFLTHIVCCSVIAAHRVTSCVIKTVMSIKNIVEPQLQRYCPELYVN